MHVMFMQTKVIFDPFTMIEYRHFEALLVFFSYSKLWLKVYLSICHIAFIFFCLMNCMFSHIVKH